MPVILPTPDELAEMDWPKRDKVIRKARALLTEYANAYVEAMPRFYRMTEEQREVAEAARRLRDDSWAEREREAARALLALLPDDPEAVSRRVALSEAS